MQNAHVYEALEQIIKAAGFSALFTAKEAAALPHVHGAHVEADRVYVSSRQIARGCYGHPAFEVQARLNDGVWFYGNKQGKLVPLF